MKARLLRMKKLQGDADAKLNTAKAAFDKKAKEGNAADEGAIATQKSEAAKKKKKAEDEAKLIEDEKKKLSGKTGADKKAIEDKIAKMEENKKAFEAEEKEMNDKAARFEIEKERRTKAKDNADKEATAKKAFDDEKKKFDDKMKAIADKKKAWDPSGKTTKQKTDYAAELEVAAGEERTLKKKMQEEALKFKKQADIETRRKKQAAQADEQKKTKGERDFFKDGIARMEKVIEFFEKAREDAEMDGATREADLKVIVGKLDRFVASVDDFQKNLD